jgi:eukaryotic-like serine/threonine-protein kinase
MMMRLGAILLLLLSAGCVGGAQVGGIGRSQPDVAEIPDVSGLTEEDARKTLARAGFSGQIEAHDNRGCPAGDDFPDLTVCGTHPPAGRRQGTRLPLTLHIQPRRDRGGEGTAHEWIRMPDIVGMSADRARAALQQQGFQNVYVQHVDQPDCQVGHVCGTSPTAGEIAYLRVPKTVYVGKAASREPPPREESDERSWEEPDDAQDLTADESTAEPFF